MVAWCLIHVICLDTILKWRFNPLSSALRCYYHTNTHRRVTSLFVSFSGVRFCSVLQDAHANTNRLKGSGNPCPGRQFKIFCRPLSPNRPSVSSLHSSPNHRSDSACTTFVTKCCQLLVCLVLLSFLFSSFRHSILVGFYCSSYHLCLMTHQHHTMFIVSHITSVYVTWQRYDYQYDYYDYLLLLLT